MKATIADIRRGDRFTVLLGERRTYFAVKAAKQVNGGNYPTYKQFQTYVVPDEGDQPNADGIIELASPDRRRVHFLRLDPGTDVEIHDRGLPIHHSSDDPPQYTDELNTFLGKTDRELAAADLRTLIPRLVSTIDNLGSERDVLVRKGLAAGISAIELAELADLSRARIYQIRDGRR